LNANYNNIFEKGSKQSKVVNQIQNMDIAIINLNSEIGSSLQTPRKFDNGSELSHFLVEKTSKS
jgi:hypothetical protein